MKEPTWTYDRFVVSWRIAYRLGYYWAQVMGEDAPRAVIVYDSQQYPHNLDTAVQAVYYHRERGLCGPALWGPDRDTGTPAPSGAVGPYVHWAVDNAGTLTVRVTTEWSGEMTIVARAGRRRLGLSVTASPGAVIPAERIDWAAELLVDGLVPNRGRTPGRRRAAVRSVAGQLAARLRAAASLDGAA